MLPSFRRPALALLTVVVGVALVGCAIDADAQTGATGDNPPVASGPVPVPTSTPSGATGGAAADASRIDTASLSAPVAAQINYALTYWSSYNPAYQHISPTDCVNFTSQTLLERGWTQDADWFYDADNIWNSSSSWLSSTSFKAYLEGRPDLAVALDDTQRDQVAVGDVVQFDWDNSGDRDHTGVVTRIEGSGDDIRIYYAGHTLDSDFRGVDESITVDHPGGTAYYWHILTP